MRWPREWLDRRRERKEAALREESAREAARLTREIQRLKERVEFAKWSAENPPTWSRTPAGAETFRCTSFGGSTLALCYVCEAPSTKLCDFPKAGRTCDASPCVTHARRVGPNRDYCPDHASP